MAMDEANLRSGNALIKLIFPFHMAIAYFPNVMHYPLGGEQGADGMKE